MSLRALQLRFGLAIIDDGRTENDENFPIDEHCAGLGDRDRSNRQSRTETRRMSVRLPGGLPSHTLSIEEK